MGCATSKPDKDETDSIVGDKNSRELPESVYFRNTKYTRSVDAPKVEGPPEPQPPATYAADVCLTDKFDEWKKEESSAAELFNSCLSVVLPIVKTEVGKQLIQLNEGGGLDIASGYKLRVVPRTGDAKRKLTPDELIKMLHVEIKTCRVRTKDTTTTLNAADDDQIANRLLNLDLKLMVVIEFGQDNVDFKLEGGGWFSPTVEMALEALKLELSTRVWWDSCTRKPGWGLGLRKTPTEGCSAICAKRLPRTFTPLRRWDMARRMLMVGFVEEPVVEWDLELNAMGFNLPDAIEDDMLTFAIRKGLGIFTIDNPLKIDLSPKEEAAETPPASHVASLPVVTSLSPTMQPVLYDQDTGVLAKLGPVAEPAEAKAAVTNPLTNRKAAIEFDSLPVVDSLGPTMRLIFLDAATGELAQLGPPSQPRGPVEAEVNFAPRTGGGTAKLRKRQASFAKKLEREEKQRAVEAKFENAGPEEVQAATKVQAVLRGKQARAEAEGAGQSGRKPSWMQWIRGEPSAEKI
jgi:hypothetical protein